MKQFRMTDRKDPPGKKVSQKSSPTDSAFDKWLNRGLHELFDDVMKEAVPPDLLRLVASDKREDDSKAAAKPTGADASKKEDDRKK